MTSICHQVLNTFFIQNLISLLWMYGKIIVHVSLYACHLKHTDSVRWVLDLTVSLASEPISATHHRNESLIPVGAQEHSP